MGAEEGKAAKEEKKEEEEEGQDEVRWGEGLIGGGTVDERKTEWMSAE